MGFYGVLWDFMGFYKFFLGFYRILWVFVGFRGSFWGPLPPYLLGGPDLLPGLQHVPGQHGGGHRQPAGGSQLGGQGQQLGLGDPQLGVQLQQHQQLGPAGPQKRLGPGYRAGGG